MKRPAYWVSEAHRAGLRLSTDRWFVLIPDSWYLLPTASPLPSNRELHVAPCRYPSEARPEFDPGCHHTLSPRRRSGAFANDGGLPSQSMGSLLLENTGRSRAIPAEVQTANNALRPRHSRRGLAELRDRLRRGIRRSVHHAGLESH